jgi:hypothetical protein
MGDKIEKNEMDGSCSSGGGGVRHYRILVGKLEGKRPLGNSSVDGRIILKFIFKKQGVRVWTGIGINEAYNAVLTQLYL